MKPNLTVHHTLLHTKPETIEQAVRAGTTVFVHDSELRTIYRVVPEGAEEPAGNLVLLSLAFIAGLAVGILVVNLATL